MAAISQPQIVYNPGSGNVTLAFVNGPQNFLPYYAGRLHDNLSTDGTARERVTENLDILISFDMLHMKVDGDMPAWLSFMGFALPGGQFNFYPNAALTDTYPCVLESPEFKPKRVAPRRYSASFVIRLLTNVSVDPGAILRRFYGVTT